MNKYKQLHQLKQQIINNLLSVEDGSRMDGYANNMLEDKTNAETFMTAIETMKEASQILELLVEKESKI